jgi:hypothetical protein
MRSEVLPARINLAYLAGWRASFTVHFGWFGQVVSRFNVHFGTFAFSQNIFPFCCLLASLVR